MYLSLKICAQHSSRMTLDLVTWTNWEILAHVSGELICKKNIIVIIMSNTWVFTQDPTMSWLQSSYTLLISLKICIILTYLLFVSHYVQLDKCNKFQKNEGIYIVSYMVNCIKENVCKLQFLLSYLFKGLKSLQRK